MMKKFSNEVFHTIKKAVIPALLFLYLLLFPDTALRSARDGLVLWYRSVLPVLFPFMMVCSVTLRLELADPLLVLLYRPFHFLFGCSRYGSFAVITGFLCGFPMGAKITSDLYRQEKISRQEMMFLYGFVNNLSPAFLISYAAGEQMGRPELAWMLLVNVLGGSILYGILTSFLYRKDIDAAYESNLPPASRKTQDCFSVIDACISETIQNTLRLGAWIMLFSILTGGIARFCSLKNPPALLLASCTEVTVGIRLIAASAFSFEQKYVMINTIAAFGGLSALAQTVGISSMDRKTALHYIKSRVACTLLSLLLSVFTLFFRLFFL